MKNRRELVEAANGYIRAGSDPAVMRRMSQLRPVDMINNICIRQWALHGMQSVQMPETYEAALMSSDCASVIEDDEPLPWPAFEVQVNTLRNQSRVFSVMVCEPPPDMNIVVVRGSVQPRIFVAYREEGGCSTTNYFPGLRAMFNPEMQVNSEENNHSRLYATADELAAYGSDQRERRVWSMVARLICGVVIAINTARAESSDAYRHGRAKTKHGVTRANTWKLGRPLEIDCRRAVSDFVEGNRGTLATQHLRRGHYRNQAVGEGRSLRRRQWIQPCWVGGGPMVVRPVKIGADHLPGGTLPPASDS